MKLTTRVKTAIEAFKSVGAVMSGRGSAVASAFLQQISKIFTVGTGRTTQHKDMDIMDKNDAIVKFSLDTMANRATGMEDPALDIFQVSVMSETSYDFPADERTVARTQKEIDGLIQRTKIKPELWQIGRRCPKYGNEFREVLIDGDNIIGLKLLPDHTMWPRMDDKGSRVPGYEQRLIDGFGTPTMFTEWEILHFAFGEIDGYLGTPMFACVRKDWKRLNACLDMMVFARLGKSFARWIHHVPVGSNDPADAKDKAINDYISKTTKAPMYNTSTSSVENWEMPEGLFTNHYLADDGTNRGKVEMLDPQNAQLQHLGDIEHIMDRIITASGIPKRYFPFEGSTPKLSEGGGSSEDKHFACALMYLQMILKKGLAELFDRQLLLKGIDPMSVRYVIRMADINTTDQLRGAQTEVALAAVMERLLKLYPEMREKLPVMLREFTKLSDASYSELSVIKVQPPKEEPVATPSNTPDDGRTQLPGSDSDNRIKV